MPSGAPAADETLAPAMDDTKASGKAGHGKYELRLGYYDNDDSPGDGNPFLDESLTVVEPVMYFDYNTSEDTTWWGKFSYDNVSSASIDRLQKHPLSQQTGASGDYYVGLDIGRRHQSSELTRNDMWMHVSAEYDYRSLGFGGSMGWDSEDHNQTTKINGNFFFDSIDLIRFDGRETEAGENRISGTIGVTRYQVMTGRMHLEYGSLLTYQEGFLSTPYNSVVLEDPNGQPIPNLFLSAKGQEVSEVLPDSRIRAAVHSRIRRQYGSSTSVEIGGRLYADDWGIMSIALEPKVYHWLVQDKLLGRARYRFYTQTAADDYEEQFTVAADSGREFRTQDSDLGDFNSHTIGFGLTWTYDEDTSLQFTGDHVLRSDGIDHIFISLGMTQIF